MESWRRNLIIVTGFLEALVLSGSLFGWPSLLLVLQAEGIYGDLCNYHITDNTLVQDGRTNVLRNSSAIRASEDLMGKLDFDQMKISNKSHSLEQNVPVGGCNASCKNDGTKNLNKVGNVTNEYHSSSLFGCNQQRIYMTLIYTFSAVSYGLTAVFIGISLDILGIRMTRIVGSTFGCLGFAFLAFTTPERSYFLWPALNLVALGTNQLRLSGFQFANLWPEYRATILTTYSSAYAISTTFFLGAQLIYEWGVPMRMICLCSGGICTLTFIPTFFMPKMRIDEQKPNRKVDQAEEEKFISTNPPSSGVSPQDENDSQSKPDAGAEIWNKNLNNEDVKQSTTEVEKGSHLSLWNSLWSVSGVFHMYWHFINLFLLLFYSSTFNIWAYRVTENVKNISFYIKMSGVCSLVAPLFIPLSGLVTDKMIKRAEKLPTPVERVAYKMQAPTFAMTGATILLACTMVCKFFFAETAVYVSLILIALSRPSVVGTCTSYIRLRFPAEQFNILNGIFTTIISILCFVQYPIMKWMTISDQSYMQAHWLLLAGLLLSLISPFHMMIKRNILTYAKQRMLHETSN